MKWNKESWSTSILCCPHCYEKINIKSKSIVSEKFMINQLYNQYNTHLCNKFGRKKVQLSIEIKYWSGVMLKTEWEYHNIILT